MEFSSFILLLYNNLIPKTLLGSTFLGIDLLLLL